MSADWRITVYDLTVHRILEIGRPAARFFYVREGSAMVNATSVEADEGRIVTGPAVVSGHGVLWVYEAAPLDAPFLPGGSIVLSRRVVPVGRTLFRADRIESPSGSSTPRHGHRGPGIRRLLYGCIHAEIGDGQGRIDPGRAWFETGTDPVIGTNIHTATSAFVRVMLLPPELAGGLTSFVASDATEAAKPRAIAARMFGEALLSL